MKIAVIFSTLSGNRTLIATDLVDFLKSKGHKTDLLDAISTDPDQLTEYELIFFGSSTYGEGDLNPITELFFSIADQQSHNCNNTRFAFFSLGDSSYPNFSTSGRLSSEKIATMHGNTLKPIFQIDGPVSQHIFEDVRHWAEGMLDQLR